MLSLLYLLQHNSVRWQLTTQTVEICVLSSRLCARVSINTMTINHWLSISIFSFEPFLLSKKCLPYTQEQAHCHDISCAHSCSKGNQLIRSQVDCHFSGPTVTKLTLVDGLCSHRMWIVVVTGCRASAGIFLLGSAILSTPKRTDENLWTSRKLPSKGPIITFTGSINVGIHSDCSKKERTSLRGGWTMHMCFIVNHETQLYL